MKKKRRTHFSYNAWRAAEVVINRRIKEAKRANLCEDYIHAFLDIKKLLKNRIDLTKKEKEISRRKRAYGDYFRREALGQVNLNDPLRILIK